MLRVATTLLDLLRARKKPGSKGSPRGRAGEPPVHVLRDVQANAKAVAGFLGEPQDLVTRTFKLGGTKQLECGVIWIDGLADKRLISRHILKPLMSGAFEAQADATAPRGNVLEFVRDCGISLGQLRAVCDLREVVSGILSGDTAVFIQTSGQALLASTRGWKTRDVEEPRGESVIRGPREGFVEDLRTNTVLLRRRIRSPNLRIETLTIGSAGQTQVAVVYLEGIANPKVVEEVWARLRRIKIDADLSDQYVEELIRDAPLSPFPTVANTERPDAVAAGILEGQVAVLVDGSPFALRMPVTFLQYFQSPEDYYVNFHTATLSRWLRLVALLAALTLPSLYVAVTTFNPEMLPTPLLVSIAAAREGVPFPVAIEAFLMELAFETLREAGLRMPRVIGPAVSIVGALVLGEAAISAGIVSAPTVIVVAFTAIASFSITYPDITAIARLLRFLLLALSAILGLFGLMTGFIAVHIHLLSLRSFGVPYMSPLAPSSLAARDILVRWPLWARTKRVGYITWQDMRRQPATSMPQAPVRRKRM